MSGVHSLLQRQMKRFFHDGTNITPEIHQFIQAVDSAYKQFDTDRKMIERSLELSSTELLQANSELRAVFQALPDVFLQINEDYRIIDAKRGESAHAMFKDTVFLGKDLSDIFPEDVLHKLIATIVAVRKDLSLTTFEYKHSESSAYFEIRLIPYRGSNVIAIIRDITERKLVEEALRDSEQRLLLHIQRIKEQGEFLDKAQDAITVRDMNNTILFWNKGSERLYGWTAEEVIGKNASTLLCYDNTEQFENIIHSVGKESSWTGELRHATRSGKEIIVESRWNIIYDDSNNPKSLLVINSDITEKKKLEAQFLRAQRMDSIGTLAGGIAHDINNILAPILLSAEVLELAFTDEKSKKILENIRKSAKRGAELIKQVLLFARGAEGEKVLLKPQKILQEITEIAKQTFPKSIEIKEICSGEIWPISADSTQIHQVLLNLCVNSRDAMPNGGTVTLTAKNVILDENYARMNPDAKAGGYVMLTVGDTGVGIPREILDKIFDPFFTTKEVGRGTGLGLATVSTIVKGHDGFITIESEVGKGSRFNIYLPSDQALSISPIEYESSEPPQGNGELLLVVDDEPAFREIAKETLELYGYRVVTASDGTDAIAKFARYHADVKVVITDMMMPYMDGAATIRSLRKFDSSVKIIAASGLMNSADLIKTSGEEVEAFLAKPYTGRKLLQTVHQVISGQIL